MRSPSPLALYVHWPFCLSKCPYCDFNSHVAKTASFRDMETALVSELETEAAALLRQGDWLLASIYFGGGTPSLMRPEFVQRVIAKIQALFPAHGDDLEITLEANPTSAEKEKFQGFREAGINRLSLGVQSFDNAALKTLGRQHSAQQARNALSLAKTIFPRFTFDLIYARPGQTPEAWETELKEALDWEPKHLSLYQLTIEKGTPYYALWRAGQLKIPDSGQGRKFYLQTEKLLADYGLYAYEVSNYAVTGQESRHNLAYWRYHSYLGIGPGAHSRLHLPGYSYGFQRISAPANWMNKLLNAQSTRQKQEMLSPDARGTEILLMGLRAVEGVDLQRFRQHAGRHLTDFVNASVLQGCLEEDYLTLTPTHLKTTLKGRIRLENILSRLLA